MMRADMDSAPVGRNIRLAWRAGTSYKRQTRVFGWLQQCEHAPKPKNSDLGYSHLVESAVPGSSVNQRPDKLLLQTKDHIAPRRDVDSLSVKTCKPCPGGVAQSGSQMSIKSEPGTATAGEPLQNV